MNATGKFRFSNIFLVMLSDIVALFKVTNIVVVLITDKLYDNVVTL